MTKKVTQAAPALIAGAAAINKAIVSIAGRGKKLDADIQQAALSVIAHVAGPGAGDVSLAEALVYALPAGSRKKALVSWLTQFGPVRELNPKANPADAEKLVKNPKALFQYVRDKLDMDGGVETPWYDCKPEGKLLEYFDIDKALATLVSRLESEIEKASELRGMSAATLRLEALSGAIAKAAAKELARANAKVDAEEPLNSVA